MKVQDHDASYHRLLLNCPDNPHLELVLLQAPEEIVEKVAIETPPIVRAATPIKPVFYSARSIAEIRANVESAGGLFNDQSDEWVFHGNHVCDGVDVEGNVFQVRSPELTDCSD